MSESIVDDIDASLTGTARIKVFGVGGGGGNAVQELIDSDFKGVQFICANTDLQALRRNQAPFKIQLGEKLTNGLGAGAKPDVGREAAIESVNAIRDVISDADMVFVTAGMGGGTGTGAAPIVAQAAKEQGILTVGIVTKPFTFEGNKRMHVANEGIKELQNYVDSLIIIPNDRLISMTTKKVTFKNATQMANEVLKNAVRGICDVILCEGNFNVDFADVRTTMSIPGLALMGIGRASGENRAKEAASQALMSPLLEDVSLESAKAILYNITASSSLTMEEVNEIGLMIHDINTDPDINIIFGVTYDEGMGEDLQLTLIATGIEPHVPSEEEVIDIPEPKNNVMPFRKSPGKRQDIRPERTSRPQFVQEEPEEEKSAAAVAQRQSQGKPGWYGERQPRPNYNSQNEYPGQQMGIHSPGKEGYTYDNSEWEIPAFIRHQAN